MTRAVLTLAGVIACFCVHAQRRLLPDTRYRTLEAAADSLYGQAEFLVSARTYDTLFLEFPRATSYDRFRAACAWIRSGDTARALDELKKAASANPAAFPGMLASPLLLPLHASPRWQGLWAEAHASGTRAEETLFRPLARQLDSLAGKVSRDREKLDSFRRAFGAETGRTDSVRRAVSDDDTAVCLAVSRMLVTYGWMGAGRVGAASAGFFFEAVMHSPLSVQRIALPKLRQAVSRGGASAADFARLEDRALVGEGRPQIYGTQYMLDSATGRRRYYPLEDSAGVEGYRREAGLPPLTEHLSRGFPAAAAGKPRGMH